MECVTHSVARFPFGNCTLAVSTERQQIVEEAVRALTYEPKERFFIIPPFACFLFIVSFLFSVSGLR